MAGITTDNQNASNRTDLETEGKSQSSRAPQRSFALSNLDTELPPLWRGSLDGCDATVLHGWAANTEDWFADIELEICLFGHSVAKTTTKHARPDLSAIMGFPVRMGFRFDLAHASVPVDQEVVARLKDAVRNPVPISEAIQVFIAESGVLLPVFRDSPLQAKELLRALDHASGVNFRNDVVSIRDILLESSRFEEEAELDVRILANYLPQFHPFPENNEWWGEGFTEWTNVVNAKPHFHDHNQPRIPADLGYYDLRLDSVHESQVNLAREYGISGFIYYFYWFSGKSVMSMPVDRHLERNYPLDFCLCWANESWSRRWDGSEEDVLLKQRHTEPDDDRFIHACIKYFKSERYIKVNGAPLLQVYRITLLANPKATLKRWRRIAKANGFPDLHICMCETFGVTAHPAEYGCDSSSQFPPHGIVAAPRNGDYKDAAPGFTGTIYDYREVVKNEIAKPDALHTQFRAAMPSWDNSSRKGLAGNVFHNADPSLFQAWLTHLVSRARTVLPKDRRFVIINAWNEWAEGAYLEPDRKYGRANLDAVRNAVSRDAHLLETLSSGDGSDTSMQNVRRYVEGLANSNRQLLRLISAGHSVTPRSRLVPFPEGMLSLTLGKGHAYVDSLQEFTKVPPVPLPLPRGSTLFATGWLRLDGAKFEWALPTFVTLRATDPQHGRRNRFGALITERVQRPDVKDLLGLAEEESWCGFKIALDVSTLPEGVYELDFLIADSSCQNSAHVISTPIQILVG